MRSPLRWLSAVTSSLMLLALAGILGTLWLVLAIPVVAGAFLLAPPLGIYRHDESPPRRSGLQLDAVAAEPAPDSPPHSARYRLVLVNPEDIPATGFRIRLLLPSSLIPPASRTRPVAGIRVGEMGLNWFVETIQDATVVTFRSDSAGSAGPIMCPPDSRMELADLVLPVQSADVQATLEYQVSGGNAKATIGQLKLSSS